MSVNENKAVPEIKQTVILDAPIQKVWETVSTAKGIASWFMPNDFEPKVGHEFHIQSEFGPSPCKVLEIEAPNHLSFVWDTDGWIVSFDLKDLDGKTEFTVVHGGWKEANAIVPKAKQKTSVIRDIMNQGWDGLVHKKLKEAVE